MKKRLSECPSCKKITMQVEKEVPSYKNSRITSYCSEKVWVCLKCSALIKVKKITVSYPDCNNYDLSE